jgi:hypothetical protein
MNERKNNQTESEYHKGAVKSVKYKNDRKMQKIFLISKVSCAKMSTTAAATALVLASLDNVKQARTIHRHLI